MKSGVPMFRIRPEQMGTVARRAEALGFESVWVQEHLICVAEKIVHRRHRLRILPHRRAQRRRAL